MGGKQTIILLNCIVQLLVFDGCFRVVKLELTNRPRKILSYMIYMVLYAIMQVMEYPCEFLIVLSILLFGIGITAYKTNYRDAFASLMLIAIVVSISTIMVRLVDVEWDSKNMQMLALEVYEIAVLTIIRLLYKIANSSAITYIYAVVIVYFIAVTNTIRIIFTDATSGLISFVLVNVIAIIALEAVVRLRSQSVIHSNLEKQVEYYQHELDWTQKSNMIIRGLKHDMNNHLEVLKLLIDSGDFARASEYIDGMSDIIAEAYQFVSSGNYEIDSILNSKIAIIKERGYKYSCNVAIPQKLDIEAVDLIIILGNMLDNAITALEKCTNDNQSELICIQLEYYKGVLSIMVKNKCAPDGNAFCYDSIELGKNIPAELKTSKGDAENHGIGISNVIKVVKKYDGSIVINKNNDEFTADIKLCCGIIE